MISKCTAKGVETTGSYAKDSVLGLDKKAYPSSESGSLLFDLQLDIHLLSVNLTLNDALDVLVFMHRHATLAKTDVWRRSVPGLRLFGHYERRAIIQRGVIEHEQSIYISSNHRMKQLMDWLSNPH